MSKCINGLNMVNIYISSRAFDERHRATEHQCETNKKGLPKRQQLQANPYSHIGCTFSSFGINYFGTSKISLRLIQTKVNATPSPTSSFSSLHPCRTQMQIELALSERTTTTTTRTENSRRPKQDWKAQHAVVVRLVYLVLSLIWTW